MESRLSEHCNDACLILAKLAELVGNRWPPRYDSENEQCLGSVMLKTQLLVGGYWVSEGWFGSEQLRGIILNSMECLGRCIRRGHSRYMGTLDLEQASRVFVEMAELLEILLWEVKRRGV